MGKIRTAYKILKTQGIWAAASVCQDRCLRWWWARRTVVELEGCKFNLSGVPAYTRYLLGRGAYERYERIAIPEVLRPDLPVVELGGCIGVIGCIVNKRMVDPAAHIVVEANPNVIPILEKNKSLNKAQFTIVHRAIAYGTDLVTFHIHESDYLASSVDAEGTPVEVQTTTLQRVLDDANILCCNLIVDIEGQTEKLLEKEIGVIAQRAETLVLDSEAELLGDCRVNKLINELEAAGMRTVSRHGQVYAFENRNAPRYLRTFESEQQGRGR